MSEKATLEETYEETYKMLQAECHLSEELAKKIANIANREFVGQTDSLKLGIFSVRDAEATFDLEDRDTDLNLHSGDPYLDLSLDAVPPGHRSRGAVVASFGLVQKYIESRKLPPTYIMGYTYERMGRLAQKHFGFNLILTDPASVSEDAAQFIEFIYEELAEEHGVGSGELGLPSIVFRKSLNTINDEPGIISSRRLSVNRFMDWCRDISDNTYSISPDVLDRSGDEPDVEAG